MPILGLMRLVTSRPRSPHTLNSSGFNLIESAIVLGIVGLVIGGIWVAAESVTANNRRQEYQKTIVRALNRMESLTKEININYVGYLADYTLPVLGNDGLVLHSTLSSGLRTAWYYQDTGYYAKPVADGYLTILYESLGGNATRYHFLFGPLTQSDYIWMAKNLWNPKTLYSYTGVRYNIGDTSGGPGTNHAMTPQTYPAYYGDTADDIASDCIAGKRNAIDLQFER